MAGRSASHGGDGLADERIDRLGERRRPSCATGTSSRQIASSPDGVGVRGARCTVGSLPANAADAQAHQLVTAQAGEEPGDGERADQSASG